MGTQQFNRYNLFYRLERHLLLHQRGVQPTGVDENSDTAKQYAKLPELPPLPARYNGVGIPKMWFLTDRTKKRSHRKSHGAASFQELAQIVSANWKTLDAESMAFVTSVSATLKAYVVANGLVLEGPKPAAKRKKKKMLNNDTNLNNHMAAKKMRVDDGRNYLGGVLLNNNYPPSNNNMPINNMEDYVGAVAAAALGNYQQILKNNGTMSSVAAAAAPHIHNNSSRMAKIRARADADHQAADADSLESRSSGGMSRSYSRRVTDDTSSSPQGLTRNTSGAAAAKVDQSPMGRLLAVGSLALEHEVEKGEAAAAVAARNKAREEQEERERQTRLLVQQELERRMSLAQHVREIERELVMRQLQNQSMRFPHHQAPSQQPVVHNGTDMSVMRMLEHELARRRAAGQNNTR